MNDILLDEAMILNKLEELKTISGDKYIKVYPHLLAHCKRQKIKDKTTLIGIAHMVYGWMPTIIGISSDIEVDERLFMMISEGSMDYEFLNNLKNVVNNSIVGVSKLLHFLNCEDYAIWDSRVYKSITGKKAHAYRVNSVDTYIAYVEQIKKVRERLNMADIRNVLIKKGYCTGCESDIRLIEMILFYTS